MVRYSRPAVRGKSGLLGLGKAQAQICLGWRGGVGIARQRFRCIGQVANWPAGRERKGRFLKSGNAVSRFVTVSRLPAFASSAARRVVSALICCFVASMPFDRGQTEIRSCPTMYLAGLPSCV